MSFYKRSPSKWKFQKNFDCSGGISPNLYFDRILLLKVYKIATKKGQRSYVSWYWRLMQNLKKKNRFALSKMTRIWWILIRSLKSLQNLNFDWSLLLKTYNLWPKKVQRNYLSWYWRVKRKTGLWFGKWHDEFGKFLPEHPKISIICTLMGCFWPKYIMFEVRKCRGVMFDGTQDWFKVEEFDMKNLANFHQSTFESLKIGTFIGSFYPK